MKKIFLLAALASVVLMGCKSDEPFDTQSEDDQPLILKPYNESQTGSFTYYCQSPTDPLVDSVTVTPSRYTTVNWYVDGKIVHTGTKINMCFEGGVHSLVIEAVTTKGKRTERTGTIIVFGGPNELWHGPKDLDWNDQTMRVTKETMTKVPLDATIRVYFKKLDDQDYYAFRVTTPWWGDEKSTADCLVPQIDSKETKSPFTFVYDSRCKGLVDERGAMVCVGNGWQVILIDFE